LLERIKRNARTFEAWIRFQMNIEIISDGCRSGKGRGQIKLKAARGTLENDASPLERIKRNARNFEAWIRFQMNIEIISDRCGSGKGRGPIKMRSGFKESLAPF
jgi:hypothetical protein